MDLAWFEMHDVVRRRLATATWIPLYRGTETKRGSYGHEGYVSDYDGVRTLAVHIGQRSMLQNIDFSRLSHTARGSVWDNTYVPAASFREESTIEIGISLAIRQTFDAPESSVLHLNQDFEIALGLIREGDSWLRPEEGYVEVAKLVRGEGDREASLLVRPDHLRDYLAARKMCLLASIYRERRVVSGSPDIFGISSSDRNFESQAEIADGRLELRSAMIHEGGHPFGAGVAVFHMGRTDVWDEDELPILGEPSDENTTSEQRHFTRSGDHLFLLSSEFRRTEIIEPAPVSVRVAGDHVPSDVKFLVDASGTRMVADDLNFEDVGRWLWFSPAIINDLLKRRGYGFEWYTRHTAGIRSVSGYSIHVGLNNEDLVVVYAHDVARLPEWERRIWAGYNVAPSGGLGDELHASQVRAEPADTQAPEAWLERAIDAVNSASEARWAVKVFTNKSSVKEICQRCHRFRSLDEAGLLSLAKDIARIVADNIDTSALHAVAPPVGGQGKGSLKSLERALSSIAGDEIARQAMGPLFGTYDLRLSDAHLPSSEIAKALSLAGVDSNQSWLRQGAQLLHNVVSALFGISVLIDPTGTDNAEGSTTAVD